MHMHKSRVNATRSVGLDAFFGENDLLTPVTPNDPGWIFNVITLVEGVKLMHMRKSCVHAM